MEGRHGLGRPVRVFDLPGAAQRVQQGAALPAHILHSMLEGNCSRFETFYQGSFSGHFQEEIRAYLSRMQKASGCLHRFPSAKHLGKQNFRGKL